MPSTSRLGFSHLAWWSCEERDGQEFITKRPKKLILFLCISIFTWSSCHMMTQILYMHSKFPTAITIKSPSVYFAPPWWSSGLQSLLLMHFPWPKVWSFFELQLSVFNIFSIPSGSTLGSSLGHLACHNSPRALFFSGVWRDEDPALMPLLQPWRRSSHRSLAY